MLVFLLLFSAPVFAEGVKVGFVNSQKILTQAPQIEDINKRLQDRFAERKKALDSEQAELQSEGEEIERNSVLMTEDKANKARKDFVGKLQQFKAKEQQLAGEIQSSRSQELRELKRIVNQAAKEVAEAKKFDLIVTEGVVYVDDKLDLTEDLLEKLKQLRAAKK
jgi:outer membrane protein